MISKRWQRLRGGVAPVILNQELLSEHLHLWIGVIQQGCRVHVGAAVRVQDQLPMSATKGMTRSGLLPICGGRLQATGADLSLAFSAPSASRISAANLIAMNRRQLACTSTIL